MPTSTTSSPTIRKSDDSRFILHFYNALREVTVLDPTCGSGAFLFAALNILEPLYEACLDRMEEMNAAMATRVYTASPDGKVGFRLVK